MTLVTVVQLLTFAASTFALERFDNCATLWARAAGPRVCRVRECPVARSCPGFAYNTMQVYPQIPVAKLHREPRRVAVKDAVAVRLAPNPRHATLKSPLGMVKFQGTVHAVRSTHTPSCDSPSGMTTKETMSYCA
ncbi:hypothetical protein E2C01_004617 [Portunus trituberculatus]|uniref:Secreted protein n=1 Tax=Portunus trituberculatus TaxID=210409 RepID=A0A5B7CST6_PORTR|nr:hypothetical protein [Portunus trituberculatus]